MKSTINPDGPTWAQGNPFAYRTNGFWVHASVVECRLDRVKCFSLDECQAALEVKDLQRTVLPAIRRRIKELERQGK
jgi:hypothetical protein